jgi:uncharacterized protein YecE (DUF72 family)
MASRSDYPSELSTCQEGTFWAKKNPGNPVSLNDTSILAGWAGAFSTWSGRGRQIYCYFHNDQAGYAVQNAQQFQQMTSSNQPDN